MKQESGVYATTAYNSKHPRELPPEPERDDSYFMRLARGRRIHLPTGPHCQEYDGFSTLAQDESLKEVDLPQYEKENRGPHRMLSWPDIFEWIVFRRSLQYVIGFFTFSGTAASTVFLSIFVSLEYGFYAFTHGFLPFFSIWLILRHLNKGELKLKKDTRFYRRTGMVSLYLDEKAPRQEIPFDEFDPYMGYSTGPAGSTSFLLQLAHRYSETLIGHPGQFSEAYGVYRAWEQLQQFMDISQPLPDTVINEPFRPFDPVTVKHDHLTKRKADLWRSLDWQDLLDYGVITADAAKDYPWGKTREQALASGWKPSEQRWKEKQERGNQDQTDEML